MSIVSPTPNVEQGAVITSLMPKPERLSAPWAVVGGSEVGGVKGEVGIEPAEAGRVTREAQVTHSEQKARVTLVQLILTGRWSLRRRGRVCCDSDPQSGCSDRRQSREYPGDSGHRMRRQRPIGHTNLPHVNS